MFPTNLVDLPNPDPKAPTNSSVTPLSGCIANLNSVVEALQAKVGVDGSAVAGSVDARLAVVESSTSGFLPATHDAVGDLIESAVSKSNPDDADLVPITDSTAGHILRKISWASIKAALGSLYARLGGVAGGQTLIGGTAASENLTLRSTAHATRGKVLFGSGAAYEETTTRLGVGTQSPAAELHAIATTEQLRIGYDTSNYETTTVSSSGVVARAGSAGQWSFRAGTSGATLGSELVNNGNFAIDLSGWTDSGASWSWSSGTALHTAGSASTLAQAITVTAGSTYRIVVTMVGRTAGTIKLEVGGVKLYDYDLVEAFSFGPTRTFVAASSGSANIIITPTSDFNGAIDSVSVKLVSQGTPVIVLRDTASNTGTQIHTCALGTDSTAFGTGALSWFLSANGSSAFGSNALGKVTTGTGNSGFGANALFSATTAIENTAVGESCLYAITGGWANACFGRNASRALVTGTRNCSFGHTAQRYLADGTTSATACSNSVYVGADTKQSADSVTNENVFGYNATGIGSNSCVIGSSSVTKCQIYGAIILDKTVTAAGTTGAQTINKTVGSVNFAAGATSLVVTNNRVTTSSIIVATVATNDTTLKSVVAVAASGSFTLTANAAATAETRVNFIVIN